MGIGIWKTKYSQLYDSLSQEEFGFIEANVRCSDDGTYELARDYFSELKERFGHRKELSGLFSSLERYFKSGGRSLSFRIF
jgi:hypothetical protein